MRITINSIEAVIKNTSTPPEEDFIIAGWWVCYQVQLFAPPQTIDAKLFLEHSLDIKLIMLQLKELWKGMEE